MGDLIFHALVMILVAERLCRMALFWRIRWAARAERQVLDRKLRSVAVRMNAKGENCGRRLMTLVGVDPVNPQATK